MNEKFYQVKDGYKRLAIAICFDTAKRYKSALRALINDLGTCQYIVKSIYVRNSYLVINTA